MIVTQFVDKLVKSIGQFYGGDTDLSKTIPFPADKRTKVYQPQKHIATTHNP